MLILSRKQGQSVLIGESITVTVNKIKSKSISVCIEAPKDTRILRAELTDWGLCSLDQVDVSEEEPVDS